MRVPGNAQRSQQILRLYHVHDQSNGALTEVEMILVELYERRLIQLPQHLQRLIEQGSEFLAGIQISTRNHSQASLKRLTLAALRMQEQQTCIVPAVSLVVEQLEQRVRAQILRQVGSEL